MTKERTVMRAKNGKRGVTGRMEIGGFEAITVMKSGDVNETDVSVNDPEDEKMDQKMMRFKWTKREENRVSHWRTEWY